MDHSKACALQTLLVSKPREKLWQYGAYRSEELSMRWSSYMAFLFVFVNASK